MEGAAERSEAGLASFFAAKPPSLSLPPWGRGTASAVDRVLSLMAHLRRSPPLFHTASTLSGSLRSPPSPRGEGFVSRKAVFSFRCLPHWGRGTAPAVNRVLSYIVDLRRISPLIFHTARTLSGSLLSPPSPRGEGFVRRYSFSTYACIRYDDARIEASLYRHSAMQDLRYPQCLCLAI